MEERNFGYLGFSFQQSLIKAIIEDKKYGDAWIKFLNPFLRLTRKEKNIIKTKTIKIKNHE